jgi:MFS family permease
VLREQPFVIFIIKRFVYLTGVSLSLPIFPLYYVHVVHANNAWIGIINTAQTAVLLVGYFLWTRQSRLRGSRFVLLWTTCGLSLYPALTALTHNVQFITVYAGLAGIFQAGIDLVFF